MASVSYSDLDSLSGELLPSRIALSLIGVSITHNTYNSYQFPAQGGGSGGGSSVAYACQANASPESNSGLLGLFSSPGANTLQCVPAATSSGS